MPSRRLRAMNWGGRYLVIGFAAGEIPACRSTSPAEGMQYCRRIPGAAVARDPKKASPIFNEITRWIAEGRLKPMSPRAFRSPRRRSHPPPHGPQGAGQSGVVPVTSARPSRFQSMTRFYLCTGVIALLALATVRDAIAHLPTPTLAHVKSIGSSRRFGDTCMFERVPASRFEWIALRRRASSKSPIGASDDTVTAEITKPLRALQGSKRPIEHQDFEPDLGDAAPAHPRIAHSGSPVDAYLLYSGMARGRDGP